MSRALAWLMLAAMTLEGPCSYAAEIVVSSDGGKLAARIDGIAFPANLNSELTSGLTNRLYARVSLMDAAEVIGLRAIEVTLRYDLWDERFTVESSVDEALAHSRHLADLEEVSSFLSALPLPPMFETRGLPRGRDLVLRVELLLNPISREKGRMIRKWVSQNTAPSVDGPSIANALFNRIFEQYASGSDIAAVWRETSVSAPFRVGGRD